MPGAPLWSAEFGVDAPGTPMSADRLLGTGSISKMLAAVAALKLVDLGQLSLSDTLGRWFAGTPNVPPGITLRQVMWHQSGLAEYGASPAYAPAVLADLNRSWQPEELLAFLPPPTFAPGTAWAASNTDRLILSMIVARTSGLPYGEYLRQRLFSSGEGGSWTPGQLSPASNPIGTHWVLDANGQPVNYTAQLFGASLFTSRLETYLTARETALFARRLFDGDLLSPAARTHLLTIVPDDGRIAGQTGGGVGIRRFFFGGRVMYGNSGGTTNSAAMYLYDPETKVVAAVSTNQGGPGHGNAHFQLAAALVLIGNSWVGR